MPDSDYAVPSTIRTLNVLLDNIRRIANPYRGLDFSVYTIQSLKTELDGYLAQAQKDRMHDGARIDVTYTASDKLAGILNFTLRMVPVGTIETIIVTASLAADASEL